MHTDHRHDFFGRKRPYIGERDYLTLRFIDDHAPMLIAMGLSIDKLEFANLKQLGMQWLRMPMDEFSNFYFYGNYFWYRLIKLLLRKLLLIIFFPIFFLLKLMQISWIKLRNSLAKISLLKKIYHRYKSTMN